ncbi:Ger(x)C family spore germination C-terminal domain-containing protein [Paenibacillus abyssi]|uniref:Ger(x)C family spore germination C-terminal domain-containing protein n=1 Tax=Paenibacillus abyssi TaxID=1340531 RepID=UPI001E451476|nr:Ger(x)C family spore germination C-terminal domain-containing protein [Paenibacillus abyssi]
MENNRIEEIAPVIFWSIDQGEEGRLSICTLVPPLVKEKKRLLTQNVHLLKEGGKLFNLIYYRELKLGQLRMLLVNEEVAKQGLNSLINTLFIDPEVSPRLYLVIIKGDFEAYIQNQLDKQPNLDYFLYRMFKHYEEKHQGEMSIVNLHTFMKNLHTPLSVPFLPVFKAGKESFTYEGTAFFRHDAMIATASGIDDQIMQLLSNDHYLRLLPIPSLSVTVGHIRSKVRIKLADSSAAVNVELYGRVEEYRGDKDILDHAEATELNDQIQTYLEKHTLELLQKMQRWKVDPLEIGRHTMTPFTKPMSDEAWLEKWQQLKFDVNYDIDIQPFVEKK